MPLLTCSASHCESFYRLLRSIAVPPNAASITILIRANMRAISLIQKIKFFILFSFVKVVLFNMIVLYTKLFGLSRGILGFFESFLLTLVTTHNLREEILIYVH